MTPTPTPRERAEAVFGHLQKAATEMILAAHEALEMVDETVAGTDLGMILDCLGAVAKTVRTRAQPPAPGAPADQPARPRGVERIAIR